MKIKKSNLMEKVIVEADDQKDLSDVNPSEASASEIASALQTSVEEISDGESKISDAAAKSAAQEIKAAATDLDAGAVALDDSIAETEEEALGVENVLTKKLDLAMRTALAGKRQGIRKNANILVTGLPGSGKTSIVFDWAKSKGVNVYAVSASDPDLEAAVYGLTLRDVTSSDRNKVTKATSNFLDSLDRPNSVLFLDEFNRASSRLRRALLMLVNEHCVNDQSYPNGLRPFKNLLFTVACINPGGLRQDDNANLLNDAEKSRFGLKLRDFDSNTETTVDFFTKYWDNAIKKLKKDDPDYMANLEEYLRNQHMGNYIVSAEDFQYDTRADLDELHDLERTMLNQRELTDGLNIAAGSYEDFKDWVENDSGFLDRDIKMLLKILDGYQVPSLKDLIAAKERELNKPLLSASSTVADASADASAVEDDSDEEDDAELFNSSTDSVATAQSVQAGIDSIMKGWADDSF